MSDKQVYYDGDYITCYPGSNQTDEGKLNLEFNMARLVTRVTSKNFCIVNPSFELSVVTDENDGLMIQVEEGQACINGMDIIATQSIRINHPDDAGTYYLALHLWRDSSDNVLGDLVVGVTKEFQGVYLDWYSAKDETDKDALWLGEITWDGEQFTDVTEDLDKYGRIWAEDILCKMRDWKHPEEERMLLQEWLYKNPDWYVSKEGDVIFGSIEFLPGRDPDVPGTLVNHEDLGSGRYGFKVDIIDDDTTNIIIKAPSTDEIDTDNIIKVISTDEGNEIDIGPTTIVSNETNNYNFELNTENRLELNGELGVTISSGASKNDCKLTLDDNIAELSDSTCTVGTEKTVFAQNTITKYIGTSSYIQYDGTDMYLNNTVGDINITAKNGTGDVNVNAAEFHVAGDITANRVYNAVYNGFGEVFPKLKEEVIEYGDVVCIGKDGLVHKVSTDEDINRVIGVCSDTIGFELAGGTADLDDDEKVEVEMLGQIWIKTDNNDIIPGDMVKVISNGKVDITNLRSDKFGIAETEVINGKVRVVVR